MRENWRKQARKRRPVAREARDIPGQSVEVFQYPPAQPGPGAAVEVFGDPLHKTRRKISKECKKQGLDTFLEGEARRSIGNYVVIHRADKDLLRIITSPGYCGGYFTETEGQFAAGTLLSPVLQQIGDAVEMDPVGLSLFLSHAPKSNFNQLPFTTMFKDVTRLPPGSVLEVQGGKVVQFRSYLCNADEQGGKRPKTFYGAMSEVSQSVQQYFLRETHMKAVVMFSGGVDSVAVFLGLREVLPPPMLKLMTMEHSASNGPDRALPTAAALGAEIELVPNDVYADGVIYDAIIANMEKDIVAFSGPHLALINRPDTDTIVFHGQNFDALANINMVVLNETQEAGYLSKAGLREAKTEHRQQRQHEAFLKNIQLTDSYLEDVYFQKLTSSFYAGLNGGGRIDPESGREGLLRGMLSSQVPNMLAPNRMPIDQVSYLNQEVARFDAYVGEAAQKPRMALDMMRFLTYSHLANKRIATFGSGQNVRPLLLAMSGPITRYLLGRPRGLTDASQPKREIYAYAKQLSGLPYRTMIRPNEELTGQFAATQPGAGQRVDAMLERLVDELDPATSVVLRRVADLQARDYVSEIYSSSLEAYKRGRVGGSIPASAHQKQILLRLANLEKLLHTNSLGPHRPH